MQHYERTGEFAKAEDALYALLESDPENPAVVEFGRAFYQRILAKTDRALVEGNLPRSEVEDGLRNLGQRMTGKRRA